MYTSVLIANRGEIACRIAATARKLGMRTIAVFSDADLGARHVRLCDEACRIGPPPASESYLNIDALIEAARRSGADCIHPGYGFLAENADFAEACALAGIDFVGPPAPAIRAMGLKDRAKALMERAGVPVVPGYFGTRQEPKFLKEKAYETGYPLLIKPVAGGGGKGMRKVERHADFDAALQAAMREAGAAFGDQRVMIERYVATPRHIEFQVLADRHGHTVHLGERDCSLQRRHQKVIEEAPAPGMSEELRGVIGAAAVAAAEAVGYVGAGTVEFIADGSHDLQADRFWFLEMNTRLQVEHPVTEAVTGFDLVEWQFRVAAGDTLALSQSQVRRDGHAVEARIYAEDPEHGFLPSTGRLVAWHVPAAVGIRVDSGVDAGDAVSPFYDPMIAKLIAHGSSRTVALDRLAQSLDQTVAAGPRTNIAFLAALCRADDFRRRGVDTGFIDRNLAALGATPRDIDYAAVVSGAAWLVEQEMARLASPAADDVTSPWDVADGFQLSGKRSVAMPLLAEGTAVMALASFDSRGVQVTIGNVPPASDATVVDGPDAVYVLRAGRQTIVRHRRIAEADLDRRDADGSVRAPMHGKLLALLVEPGAEVQRGQRVAIIEAMKMEHALTAPRDGLVAEITGKVGSQVAEDAVIMHIEARALSAEPGAGKE